MTLIREGRWRGSAVVVGDKREDARGKGSDSLAEGEEAVKDNAILVDVEVPKVCRGGCGHRR